MTRCADIVCAELAAPFTSAHGSLHAVLVLAFFHLSARQCSLEKDLKMD